MCSDVADFTASTASRSWEALKESEVACGTFKGFIDPVDAVYTIPKASWKEGVGISLGLMGFVGSAIVTRGASLAPTVATTTATTAIRQTALKAVSRSLVNRVRTTSVKTAGNIGTQVAKSNRTAQLSQILQGPPIKEGLKLDLDALSRAGQILDRGGLTRAGRALDKHGNRPGSVFPKATGNPVDKNRQGQFHLDDILTHPESTIKQYNNQKYGDIVDVRLKNGQGVRYSKNGDFIMFLEP